MADRPTDEELVAAIPRDQLGHFDELAGLEQREALEGIVITPTDYAYPGPAPVPGYPSPRATSITSAMMLETLREWGVAYKVYVPSGGSSTDWLTWNRNAQQGWGPLYGVIVHNTAMTVSEANQLAYLRRGDGPNSDKPGPLCQFAVGKDGMIWLIGWGCATHSGTGDPDTVNAAMGNRLPLTSEITPNTSGLSAGTLRVNPHFFGIEQMHASEGPTDAQHKATVRLVAALLWLLGGPRNGYSGGSVGNHRELTYNRSDPQGVPKNGLIRREADALLAIGPKPVTPPPPPPPPVKPPVVVKPPVTPPKEPAVTIPASDLKAIVNAVWRTDGIIEAPATETNKENTHWRPFSFFTDLVARADRQEKALKAQGEQIAELKTLVQTLIDRSPA